MINFIANKKQTWKIPSSMILFNFLFLIQESKVQANVECKDTSFRKEITSLLNENNVYDKELGDKIYFTSSLFRNKDSKYIISDLKYIQEYVKKKNRTIEDFLYHYDLFNFDAFLKSSTFEEVSGLGLCVCYSILNQRIRWTHLEVIYEYKNIIFDEAYNKFFTDEVKRPSSERAAWKAGGRFPSIRIRALTEWLHNDLPCYLYLLNVNAYEILIHPKIKEFLTDKNVIEFKEEIIKFKNDVLNELETQEHDSRNYSDSKFHNKIARAFIKLKDIYKQHFNKIAKAHFSHLKTFSSMKDFQEKICDCFVSSINPRSPSNIALSRMDLMVYLTSFNLTTFEIAKNQQKYRKQANINVKDDKISFWLRLINWIKNLFK